MATEKEEENKKKHTPIIDGDARPDIDLHPEDQEKLKGNKKTTVNRVDTNSLEDFRDAKKD